MNANFENDADKKATGFANGRALVIAVANYDEITSLPEAVLNDARDISGALSSPNYCGYDSRNVTTLLDKAATIAAIRHGLATLAPSSREEDTAFIYFSGHGARLKQGGEETSLLLPVDCQRSNLFWYRAPLRRRGAGRKRRWREFQARRLLVVLDACHSGGAGSLKQDAVPGLEEGYAEKDLHRLAEGTGRVIMASSRSSETSQVLRGARNSVFTERFLEALRGAAPTHGDGLIRVF